MPEHNLEFNIEVPTHYIDEDGNLKHEFYEPLFKMLGKKFETEDGLEFDVKEIHVGDLELDKP